MNQTLPNDLQSRAVAARARSGLFRFSMVQFLVALVFLIVTYPFVLDLNHGDAIENILMSIVFISAAMAVGGRHTRMAFLLVIPAICGPGLDLIHLGLVPIWVITGTHVIFVAYIVYQLQRFVLKSPRVNTEVMCAGIGGYLTLGILWAPIFLMISELTPNSFLGTHFANGESMGRFDALYLSFVSLTSLGCNDITPLSKAARMLVMVEAIVGVLYLAVLIARLVALYSQSVQNQNSTAGEVKAGSSKT